MDLMNISGIGPKSMEYLNKLNIYNIDDLINYYPFRYNIIKPVNELIHEELSTINVKIITNPKMFFFKAKQCRITFDVLFNNTVVKAVLFNRQFIRQYLTVGKEICITGNYNKMNNQFIINDLKLNPVHQMIIEPVYHKVNGLKSSNLIKYINNALKLEMVNDMIPSYLAEQYHFINKLSALKEVHNPSNLDNLKKARLRLIYEELFTFSTKVNYLAIKNKESNGLKRVVDYIDVLNFIDTLPFNLTPDQTSTVESIYNDLTKDLRMNRLVLGDVGSGKTIVSFIAMYINYLGKYQSALMAPTEILAIQHYHNILKIMPPYINIRLITGKTSKKEKELIYNELQTGLVDMVIGTHSLLNDNITFNNLGLVITDEQHRFGVNARKTLYNKGIKPDVLYMSATPIPRTYAMTLYGDMDTSIIKSVPGNRKQVLTKVVKEDDIKEVLIKVKEELSNNHQVYIVAPTILENEENELNNVYLLKEKYQKAFPNAVIGILHGKMKNDEKNAMLDDFVNNKINILISTTVIEVGIDVGNATMMIIYNGERFGLATLHQLRGRVGRSDLDAYCYIVSEKKTKRLEILETSTDGFYIAEEDFKLRGEGDLFGTNQSGDMSFKIASLTSDYKILLQTIKDSKECLNNNLECVNSIINSLNITS